MIIQGNDPYRQPSFSWRNRLGRTAWSLAWLVFCRYSPKPFHGWRAIWLRLFGAEIGKDVHIYPRVDIWAPWNLKIGDRVGIGNGATIYSMEKIEICSEAVISQGAHLCAGSHDIDSPNFQLVASPIFIGPRAWVCAEVFVGPGVRIAPGCVLGARAVVMRSITDPWTVWSGNPAIHRRKRTQHTTTCDKK